MSVDKVIIEDLLTKLKNIRYWIVPYVAPLAPALVSGMGLYLFLVGTNDWNPLFSALAAVALGAAVELGGLYIAKILTDSIKRGSKLGIATAIGGLTSYVVTASYLVSEVHYGLIGVVFITLFVYLGAALQSTYQDDKEAVRDEGALELALAVQATKKASAEARTAKHSRSPYENGVNLPINDAVKKVLLEDPDRKLTQQQVADLAQVAIGTANKHIRRFDKQANGEVKQ